MTARYQFSDFNFLIEAFVEPINSFAHGAFYIFYSLIHLSINIFLLLYKIPHHLAQIHNSMFYWGRGGLLLLIRGGPILLLLLCTWGNICWRFRLLGEVGVVLPVGIVGVAILGLSWCPILAHNNCMFSHQIPY